MNSRSLWLGILLYFPCVVCIAGPVRYLVIGGGHDSQTSQVALETNVSQFHDIATAYKIATDDIWTVFGAGTSKELNDVLVKKDGGKLSDDEILAASLYYKGNMADFIDGYDAELRHNKLGKILGTKGAENGAATRANVMALLDAAKAEKKNVRIYYTGHGTIGSQVSDHAYNPAGFHNLADYQKRVMQSDHQMLLWQGDKLSMADLTTKLDTFDQKQNVQLVAVQCFSGGFARMSYRVPNRCGFFSQMPERMAAGCSKDVNDRKEYSVPFFAALDPRGKKEADFDRNGAVSGREAHAWAVINDSSYDVPVATSDQMLFDYYASFVPKRFGSDGKADASDVVANYRFDRVESGIVDRLAKALDLDPMRAPNPFQSVRDAVEKWRGDAKLAKAWDAESTLNHLRNQMRLQLAARKDFDFLANKFEPFLILNQDRRAVTAAFAKQDQHKATTAAYTTWKTARPDAEEVERKIAKGERLMRVLETKLLLRAIDASEQKGAKNVRDKYDDLVNCESERYF